MNLARLLAVTVLFSATVAPGQEQPNAAANPADPGVSHDFRTPYGGSPFMRDAREFDRQSPLGWPAAEVRELAFARARTLVAEFEKRRAAARLNEEVDRIKRRFERSTEYRQAEQEVEEAWAAHQVAMASVQARLMEDPGYAANVALASEIGEQIRDVAFRQGLDVRPAAISPDLVSMAKSRLQYASRASAARAAAADADPQVQEARAQLQTASARLRQLRDDFNNDLKDHPTLLALREDLEAQRINAIAAHGFEQMSRNIASEVMTYTYNLLYSGRSWYDHGRFDTFAWPVIGAYDVMSPRHRQVNHYGFRRR